MTFVGSITDTAMENFITPTALSRGTATSSQGSVYHFVIGGFRNQSVSRVIMCKASEIRVGTFTILFRPSVSSEDLHNHDITNTCWTTEPKLIHNKVVKSSKQTLAGIPCSYNYCLHELSSPFSLLNEVNLTTKSATGGPQNCHHGFIGI